MKVEDSTQQLPTYISLTKDPYNAYHIRIIGQVSLEQFINFVQKFTSKQISQNQSKDLIQQTTAIWVILNVPYLHFVSNLCKKQFQIHSGVKNTITLNKWIAKRKNLIPAFSVFYISCCAVLIKDDCIFLVQQKTGQRKFKYNLPGGRADPGETIVECVQRQLFQQTNIKAKFKYMIDFREATHAIYNSVDSYFACYLQCEEDALKDIKLCERQLICYKWVPLSQYLEFSKSNSTSTQITIAQYITRLWKEGFDFKNKIPNQSKLTLNEIGNNQVRKFYFHELANL